MIIDLDELKINDMLGIVLMYLVGREYYKLAMNSISNDILDWADYAFKLALIHKVHGENQLALDLLQQALIVRKQFENETDDMTEIQHLIDSIKNVIDVK